MLKINTQILKDKRISLYNNVYVYVCLKAIWVFHMHTNTRIEN